MAHTEKLSTMKLIKAISKKLSDELISDMIIQSTNDISVNAAVNLWCPLETQEKEDNQVDIRSYTNLMETLVSLLKSD
ncbi:unnamed protein product, partial [Adineta steineri]